MIIGVLGGGQLGRMLALAGYPLGLRFRFLDPDSACPAGQVGELVVGAYDDPAALERFVRGVDVVTYEFENVPARSAQWLTDHVPVFPPQLALATAQDRLLEKQCFHELGIATPEFAAIDTLDDLRAAVRTVGLPAVLKTRRLGYDGKGQAVLRDESDLETAFLSLGGSRTPKAGLILEAFVPFVREVSIIGVRARDGSTALYPPVWNIHSRGMLSRSEAPAPGLDPALRAELESAARRVMDKLRYVGILAIEFFELAPGSPRRLMANEMAPRVHNSGHWSIEGSQCSQFENHIRAVAGLPLGSTRMRSSADAGSAVMYNIVGEQPAEADVLAIPGASLHMYGKSPRQGRKLGHVTLVCAERVAFDKACADIERVLERDQARP